MPKIWNRRKSTGAAAAAAGVVQDSLELHGGCEKAATAGDGDDGDGDGDGGEGGGGGGGKSIVSDRATAGRTMGRRIASAPVMVESASFPSSASTRAWDGANTLGDSTCTAATTTESLDGLNPRDVVVATGDNAGDAAAGEERTTPHAPFGATTTASATARGRRRHRRGDSLGAITSPNSADVLSAPFLVARISGVGAELKDIMWAVRQTHFPYLKTAGSLQATLSGLTIEVELDMQDLPAGPGKDQGGGGNANDGISSSGNARKSGGGDGGGDGGGGPMGLKLTRLRVSVLAVKVHVKNNALSAVYNLAASAFEAAVKRYVVDNVEAAVRRNITALLTIINTQLSAKWDVLCKVGGGGGGGSGGDLFNPLAGNAVEKVLAASLSHHLVWPADSSSSTATAPADVAESAPVSDQPSVGQVSRSERLGSGSSRGSAESKGSGGGGGSGIGTDAAAAAAAGAGAATSVRKRLAKQSFRILGSVDRTQSAEDMSKLLSSSRSSSASSSSTSIPRLASSSFVMPPPPTSSARAQLYTRPPVSPTLSSQNSSSTTLSEWGTGTMTAPPVQEAALSDGVAAAAAAVRRVPVQERRWMWRRGGGSASSVSEEQRRMSTSPPRKQPRGLRRIGDAEKDAGVFSDGGVIGRQREAGATTKDFWRDSPTNTAAVMSGRRAGGSIWVGDS